jgi:hypothetical protein
MANRDFSMEAYKASELMNVLLYHIRMPAASPNSTSNPAPVGAQQSTQSNNDEQTAAMTLGMLQAGAMNANGAVGQGPQQPSPGAQWDKNTGFGQSNDMNAGVLGAANASSPFPSIFGGGIGDFSSNMNLDWVSWDPILLADETWTNNKAGSLGSIHAAIELVSGSCCEFMDYQSAK